MSLPPEEPSASTRRVVGLLNRGLEQMPQRTRGQLHALRTTALEAYREDAQPAHAWAWAGLSGGHSRRRWYASAVCGAVLLLSAGGVIYRQFGQPEEDAVETEISLLTGELPINAYLDNGFDEWLKRSAP